MATLRKCGKVKTGNKTCVSNQTTAPDMIRGDKGILHFKSPALPVINNSIAYKKMKRITCSVINLPIFTVVFFNTRKAGLN